MALTPKQRRFAELVAEGNTLADSYRGSYNASKMKPAVVRNEASALMGHHDVSMLIERLRARKEQAIMVSGVNDAELVRDRLRRWMDDAEPCDNMKLKAAELLGRSAGIFKDVVITDDKSRTADEIRQEISDRLAALEDVSSDTRH